MTETVLFWIIAPLSLGTALSVVVLRNPVHAALMLVGNFFTIAVLYAVMEAQFLAVVQIIVYAGAIMVLFLFVIMLLGVESQLDFGDRIRGQRAAAVFLGVVLLAALTVGVAGPYLGADSACPTTADQQPDPEAAASGQACRGLAEANADGNVFGVGRLVFTDYVWPFEVTSVLLVIAALGAMVLGRRAEQDSDLVDVPRRERVPVGAVGEPTYQAELQQSLEEDPR